MDRHFLIAVSDEKSALHGVRFVGDFFSDKGNIKSTLFYSSPKAPLLSDSEKNIQTISRQKDQQRKLLAKGKKAIEAADEVLLEKGFVRENLYHKAQTQVFSKVADIIHEGEDGAYDAVVLGRRGLTMIEEAFEESVSKALFKENFTFPLWLCTTSDPSRKDILLYLDGSDASIQMADHVGFILGEEKDHHVDIMALEAISSQSSLMDQYTKAIMGNGVDTDRIRNLPPVLGNPAKEILKRVETGPYASVALGRASSEGNIFSRLFRGPVCSSLFREMKDAALWLCP